MAASSKPAKAKPDFFGWDRPHSKAKRTMLKGILHAFFGMNFSSIAAFKNVPYDEYLVNYFDGFCGRGSYTREDIRQTLEEEDVCRWGSPVIALQACHDLVQKLWDRHKKALEAGRPSRALPEYLRGDLKFCRFHFCDVNYGNLRDLAELVIERMELLGWSIQHTEKSGTKRNQDQSIVFVAKYGDFFEVNMEIRVDLVCQDFNLFDTSRLTNRPLFSFVDPCGYNIEMQQVKKLMGDDKLVFVNLMVGAINRNQRMEGSVNKVYGGAFWQIFNQEGLSVNEKLLVLALEYENALKAPHPKGTAVSFALRKGKSSPEVGTLFHMVFGATGLTMLQKMKTVMQKFVQSPDGKPAFTNYYFHKCIDVALGRKTSDRTEARVIFQLLKGRVGVRLGEVKRIILEQTFFPYHARAMRVLEKEGLITNVDTHGDSRVNKSLKSLVSYWPDGVDAKYGNDWTLDFACESTEKAEEPDINCNVEPAKEVKKKKRSSGPVKAKRGSSEPRKKKAKPIDPRQQSILKFLVKKPET